MTPTKGGGSTIAFTPNAVMPRRRGLCGSPDRRRDHRWTKSPSRRHLSAPSPSAAILVRVPPPDRHPRGASAATQGGPEALGDPARRGRRAGADRPAPGRRPHARDHPAAADRGRQALRARGLRLRPAGVGRAPDRLARLDRLSRLARLGVLRPGAIAPELDRELQAWTRRVQTFAQEAFAEELRRLRVRLEDKEAIAALHWRGVPDEEGAQAAIERSPSAPRRPASPPLGPQGARDPAARADRQGRRHRRAAARPRPRRRALRRRRRDRPRRLPRPDELVDDGRLGTAVRVGVRSDEGPSALAQEADVMVEGTDGVRDMLQALLATECGSATSSV